MNDILTLSFMCCSQASEEASLRALESLMTEFFHNCTTNERKREIGEFMPFLKDGPLYFRLPANLGRGDLVMLNIAHESALSDTKLAS